jgi:hypothetical protein
MSTDMNLQTRINMTRTPSIHSGRLNQSTNPLKIEPDLISIIDDISIIEAAYIRANKS